MIRPLVHLSPAAGAPLLAYSACGLDSASVVVGARRSADLARVTCPSCRARAANANPYTTKANP